MHMLRGILTALTMLCWRSGAHRRCEVMSERPAEASGDPSHGTRSKLDLVSRRRADRGNGRRRYGAVLKVSEDGLITFYDQQERIWDI